jgi:hypothetical protein
MLFTDLSTAHVLKAFTEGIEIRGGKVTESFDDGSRLFARSVLCKLAEIQPGDQLRGGVAIKATQEGIWLYPYTFRLVCSNGAIHAETLDERPVAEPRLQTPDAVLRAVREAVAACSKEEVFSSSVDAMQRSRGARAVGMILSLLPLMSRFSSRNASLLARHLFGHRAEQREAVREVSAVSDLSGDEVDLLFTVVDRYRTDGDPSRFGLANAITATARDVQDPDLKWELEKLGGSVAAGKVGSRPEETRLAAALVADAAELAHTA